MVAETKAKPRCHDERLTSNRFKLFDGEIIHAIKTGPSVMPSFGKKLSPSEIDALAKYVRTFKPVQ